MHSPVRCALVEMFDVKDIACGYGFTVFAVNQKSGQLMGTGINKDGQIGTLFLSLSHPSINLKLNFAKTLYI